MKNLQKVKVKLKRLITGSVIVNTDEYDIYRSIASEIKEVLEHWVVNHSEKEWAHGSAHVNGCENRNQFLKAYLRRYRGVSKKYLQGYVDFLSLLLNEGSKWFDFILSDYLPT
jgi:transposase-like protein